MVEEFNGISIFTCKRYKIILDIGLNKDLKMAPEDASELSIKYVNSSTIDSEKFNMMNYFLEVGSFLVPCFLLPKELHPTSQKAKPLIVHMLVESTKAGR